MFVDSLQVFLNMIKLIERFKADLSSKGLLYVSNRIVFVPQINDYRKIIL